MLLVSRSGYYKWCSRQPSTRENRQQEIVQKIKQVHLNVSEDYGSPRVHRELVESLGVACSRNTIAKLMRQQGIAARSRRRFRIVTTDSNHEGPFAENLLSRDFVAQTPNRVWLMDFTYLQIASGFCYMCAVEDLCSRRIVGWEISHRIDAELACKALQQAIDLRSPADGLIVHSDRGSQFASVEFRMLLDSNRLRQSMSRKGNCYDNAPMESFFGRFKVEHVHWHEFRSIHEARKSVTDYIDRFYNPVRRHSALGYVSPQQFEDRKLFEIQQAS